MSPSKQKSQDRQAARDRKVSTHQTAGAGTGASAYNPSSGTFHDLAPRTSDTGLNYPTGRFKSIVDVDDNTRDVDCISNNGSYSGESEDQQLTHSKDKSGSGKPGIGGADKRDKVRGKNERKHQRQKERRAQELRDKCTSYLMSRKLEALAQKLVAMGFSQEQATMALIVNVGHVEQSIASLLEGGEGQVHEDWNTGGNPKIDISEELGQILEIEKKYNFSRPDIERAVVSCEGDLSKAIDQLRANCLSPSPDHEEDRRMENGSQKEVTSTMLQVHNVTQHRSSSVVQCSYPSRRDDRVVILSPEGQLQNKVVRSHIPLEGSLDGSKASATDSHGLLPSSRRRGYTSVVSGSVAPSYASNSKAESGMIFGFGTSDSRSSFGASKDSTQIVPEKDCSLLGQTHVLGCTRAQLIMSSNNHSVTSPALSPSSWSDGFMEEGSPSSVLYLNTAHAGMELKTGKKSMEYLDIGPSDTAGLLNSLLSMQSDSHASEWTASGKGRSVTHSRSPSGTSFGLFTGWGAGLSHSTVDWSTGPISNCDYRNIDWSLNSSSATSQGISSRLSYVMLQDTATHYQHLEADRRFEAGFGGASFGESTTGKVNWKLGSSIAGVQNSTSFEPGNTPAYEWTSPFAGKNLFDLPQSVSSPSL